MNPLLQELVSVSKGLRGTKEITLPMSGKTIHIKGLMTGELQRIGLEPKEKQLFVQMALSWVDDKGQLVMNPNDLEDMEGFNEFHGTDTTFAANEINALSGQGTEAEEKGKGISSENQEKEAENGSSSTSPLPRVSLSAA